MMTVFAAAALPYFLRAAVECHTSSGLTGGRAARKRHFLHLPLPRTAGAAGTEIVVIRYRLRVAASRHNADVGSAHIHCRACKFHAS